MNVSWFLVVLVLNRHDVRVDVHPMPNVATCEAVRASIYEQGRRFDRPISAQCVERRP